MMFRKKSSELEQLKIENENLKKTVQELSIVNDIATAIASTMSVDDVLNLIVSKCIKHFQVEQAAVFLVNNDHEDDEEDMILQTRIRQADVSHTFLPLRLNDILSHWMVEHKETLMINDIKNDTRFSKALGTSDDIVTLMAVPMFFNGEMTGTLTLFNKKNGKYFDKNDENLISIVSSNFAQILENARLLDEEKKLIKIQNELQTSKRIQEKLLPKEIPSSDQFDISATMTAASEVGGDYYDFIFPGNDNLVFCCGDVSGKGLPAALLMSNLQANVRGQSMIQNENISESVGNINNLIFHNTTPEKYATLFYGRLNPHSNSIFYTNAGHNKPILFQENKEPQFLTTNNLPIGLFENSQYDQGSFIMNPGDILVVFTDGITEAINTIGEEFGEERVVQIISKHLEKTSSEIMENLLEELKQFAVNTSQHDDITLMILKRTQ